MEIAYTRKQRLFIGLEKTQPRIEEKTNFFNFRFCNCSTFDKVLQFNCIVQVQNYLIVPQANLT